MQIYELIMATLKDLQEYLKNISEEYLEEVVPVIVSEVATEYFKQRFTTKEWNGEPWPDTKRPVRNGSLMVRSGALMASIKPHEISRERVTISAGSEKVPYAKIHNEGGAIKHPGGTPYFVIGKKEEEKSILWTSKEKATAWAAKHGRSLPVTKQHDIIMPKRQFMGMTDDLVDEIIKTLEEALNNY